MNAARLLALYERIADAPDTVARLRRFVLDLAVRGKLVPQDPRDEPADKLLRRIARVRGEPEAVYASGRPHPFDTPASWCWTTLGTLVLASDAGWSPKTADHPRRDGTWGVLKVSAVSWDRFRPDENKEVLPGTEPRLQAQIAVGDFLISRANTAELVARAVIVDVDPGRLMMSDKIVRLRLSQHCDHRFVWLVNNNADFARHHYATHASGVSPSMKNVSRGVILGLPFPLPPLAEQHRIVAKVDELMALCDRLEAARTAREATRDRLAAASLARLNAPDPETFPADARFALNALPAITTRPDQIKHLRQTILNLAVCGKLVAQKAQDEAPRELLDRVVRKKAELIREGAIARSREAVADPKWRPAALPPSWQPIALGQLCGVVTSGSRGWAEFYATSGPGFVRAQNIRFGRLKLDDLAHVNPPRSGEGTRTQIAMGDLLIVITGAGVTNPAIVDQELGEAYVSQHVGLVRPILGDLSPWLLLCLMADRGGRAELVERAYGAGKPGLNLDNIRSLSVPFPPFAEQHRIVAKVNELMSLCDALEASLAAATTARTRLLEASLAEALAPATARELEAAE